MSVSGFSFQHDAEHAGYKELERAVLASEAQRKEEQRQRRLKMGLSEIEDNRGILHRLLRTKRCRPGASAPAGRLEKPMNNEAVPKEKEIDIHEFLQTRP